MTHAEVNEVDLSDRQGRGALLDLRRQQEGPELATGDVVGAIAVFAPNVSGGEDPRGSFEVFAESLSLDVFWEEGMADGSPRIVDLRTERGNLAYDESFCQLPDLRVLLSVRGAHDFSSIADCNPMLEQMRIFGWNESAGREELAGLRHLRSLDIYGPVNDARELAIFASMDSLESLRVELPANGKIDPQDVRELLPDLDVQFA
ncbi:MAG: hypothetical protein LBK95_10400 [Bifidobacteriaceae bacterium]|nr:hypothetical protein [Bifidobacteriaceae bacterium]